jgi:hypothetical protein
MGAVRPQKVKKKNYVFYSNKKPVKTYKSKNENKIDKTTNIQRCLIALQPLDTKESLTSALF